MDDKAPATEAPFQSANKWQHLQSFFRDVLLEKLPAPPEPELELWLRNGRMMLVSPGAIYSREERYGSFLGAFEQEGDSLQRIEKLLVLGFGLGSIPIILERIYNRSPQVTGVDLDERIIDMAHRRCPQSLMDRTELICADALQWIPEQRKIREASFDMICVDLFIDTEVPRGCSDPDWLQSLAGLLSPGGRLLVSRMRNENKGVRRTGRNRFRVSFQKLFPEGDRIQVAGNDIYRWTKPER